MNIALIKKEIDDILAEKLYIFAFLAQLVIVMGVLYAALLYTSVASPQTSTFVQTQKVRFGVAGSDAELISQLEEDLEVVRVSEASESSVRANRLVGLLHIQSDRDFVVILDNTNLLSGYAETIVNDALSERSAELKRHILEEKMETADIILNPISLKEKRIGTEQSSRPPEFIVVMYGLLIPFILLLPTFLATNMVTDSIVGEKEKRTYEMLVAAPITKWEIILSKIVPIMAVALLQSLLWVALLEYKGLKVYNIPLLIILLLLVNFIFIGLGVLISAYSETLKESNLSVTIALLITSIAMFAPLNLKAKINSVNPVLLMTKIISNPKVRSEDLTPLIALAAVALLALKAGEHTIKNKQNLRL